MVVRVLVTGAEGQLAKALAEHATGDPGIEVLTVGRPTLDLTDPRSIERVLADRAPHVVVNAAAYTAVDKAESEPELAFAVNRDGARLVAAASCARAIPIIHISTDYVFDGNKPAPYVESDPIAPQNVYGRSKAEGEAAVRAANPQHLILRTAWVYSATGNNFVRTMLRLAADRPSLNVVDDQVGSPTYAPDLAAVVLELAEHAAGGERTVWGTYHAAGSGAVSWCGLAREVFRVSQSLGGPSAVVAAISTSGYPTPARRPANSRLDGSRLADVFGLRLPAWELSVAACVERLLRR